MITADPRAARLFLAVHPEQIPGVSGCGARLAMDAEASLCFLEWCLAAGMTSDPAAARALAAGLRRELGRK